MSNTISTGVPAPGTSASRDPIKRRKTGDWHRPLWLLLLLPLLGSPAWAGDLHLTPEEQDWVQAHPLVRLGIDPGYGPYSFVDLQGRVQGVVADLLPLIEQQLGLRFEIVHDLDWPHLMTALREKRLDAVATVVKLPERESFIAFSRIYLSTPLVIMTRNETPSLHSLAELRRLRLVLVKGYSSSKQLIQQFPDLQPSYVTSPVEGLRAVATGKADAYVGVLGVNTFLANREGITNLKVNAAFEMASNGQRFGVRKDWPLLATLLDKTLDAIPAARRKAIMERWLPRDLERIERLARPGSVTRLFPWLLGALGLALLGYILVLLWNRQLKRQLARRSAQLQQALTETGQRKEILESVFAALPDLFFLMRADGTILEYHARQGSDLYMPPEAFLGRRMQDVLPPALARQFESSMQRVQDERALVQYEYELPLADGNHQFDARLSGLADSDHVIAVIRDITETHLAYQQLAESEARYREMLESMIDGFVALDRDWCYLYVNRRAGEMLEREPAALIGRNVWEEFPEGVGQPFYHAYHKAMQEQVMVEIEGYYPPWKRWYANRILPTGHGISIYFQDITVRKQAEETLRKSHDELEEQVRERTRELEVANQELETFTYSVSHDLKAPLRGIDGYSRLLLEEYSECLDPEGRQFLDNIRQGVRQMSQLIDDLLAYSRMERREIHHQPLDLAALVQRTAAEYRPQLDEQSVELSIDIDPLTIHADPDGLSLVLRNLLDNAIKFSAGRQPPRIRIGMSEQEKTVTLFIEDNGIGFDMHFHDRIFAIFQRLQRSEDYPGTGIGLAIVHKAMQRMGGRVWAESTPGEGARFYLELPR